MTQTAMTLTSTEAWAGGITTVVVLGYLLFLGIQIWRWKRRG